MPFKTSNPLAKNLGNGTTIYAGLSGETLNFKSLIAGTGLSLSDSSTGVTISSTSTGSASGENIKKEISQTSHGFNVGDFIGWSGDTYNKAIANGLYDGEFIGLVSDVPSTDIFKVVQAGYVTGLTSLVANTTYFLSPTTAGLLTSTEPTGDTQISKAVLIADSTTSGWVLPYAGYVVTTGDSGGTWGTITGTISDQDDLQDALDLKADYSALTASTIYNLNSPSTSAVGGTQPGYVLAGKSISCIIQDAFAPYIVPTFSVFNISGTYPIEVGEAMSGSKTFTWTTTTSGNVAASSIGISEVGGSTLAIGLTNDGTEALNIGTKTNTTPTTWTWRISGNSTQSNGFTRDVAKCSIYPYFWGVTTCATRPDVTNTLVTGGTKVTTTVGSSVSIAFNSSGQWTWFAMPETSTSRTKWFQGAAPNCGNINNLPTDKYPDECIIPITSGQGCWSGINYKIYMSGSAATDGSTPIEFRTY